MEFNNKTEPENPLTIPVHVGTMGWGYTDWAGSFYPPKVPARDYITLYGQVFDTVEIDSTFYGTPREPQVKSWAQSTPDNFVFCPKVPRAVTHEMRLVDAIEPLAEFVRVMGLLGPKRGPMLLQMPPDFTINELDNLATFLPSMATLQDPTARFAIEFRHRSLIGPDVNALLAEYNVALASVDYVVMPRRFDITGDFAYIRLIGQHGEFSHYRQRLVDRMPDLVKWASALRKRQERLKVAYVFCNNEYEGFGPETCNRFKALVGLPTLERPPEEQGSLF